jgi:hypothetical protein
VGFDNNDKRYESVYARKVKAGKRRTYFFDVRQTKGDDYYVTITESTRRFNDEGYTRHKIFLYKEDFNRFMESLTDVVDHVKNELMPDYDYEEYDRRYDEDGEENSHFNDDNESSKEDSKEDSDEEVTTTETTIVNEESKEEETDGEKW